MGEKKKKVFKEPKEVPDMKGLVNPICPKCGWKPGSVILIGKPICEECGETLTSASETVQEISGKGFEVSIHLKITDPLTLELLNDIFRELLGGLEARNEEIPISYPLRTDPFQPMPFPNTTDSGHAPDMNTNSVMTFPPAPCVRCGEDTFPGKPHQCPNPRKEEKAGVKGDDLDVGQDEGKGEGTGEETGEVGHDSGETDSGSADEGQKES